MTNLGHCHPAVTKAAVEQVQTLVHGQVNLAYNKPYLGLIEALIPVMPHKSLDTFFFWLVARFLFAGRDDGGTKKGRQGRKERRYALDRSALRELESQSKSSKGFSGARTNTILSVGTREPKPSKLRSNWLEWPRGVKTSSPSKEGTTAEHLAQWRSHDPRPSIPKGSVLSWYVTTLIIRSWNENRAHPVFATPARRVLHSFPVLAPAGISH